MAGQSIRSTKHDLLCMVLDEDAEPNALTLPLLTEITNGFSDKLEIGRGGFAVVYKGMLEGRAVAVKRLLKTYMYEKEFLREVECLMKVRHKNIVRFLGYCVDSQGNVQSYNEETIIAEDIQKILCFEYLPKGTLSGYITDESGGLDWRTRYQIIKGMCEGLQYLHKLNIVHLDLKPDNVLLDEMMIPKITDFGLSRCFKDDQTRWENTKVGGTFGYLAPEFNNGTITYKFDLYSLGVIIIEIITGKRGYQDVEDVVESWNNRCDRLERKQIHVCAEIGLECYDLNPGKRPKSIKHIVDRLAETESSSHEVAAEVVVSNELLGVRSSALCFPFKNWGRIRSPLHLTSTTDEYVAFMLEESGKRTRLVSGPSYGIVPPRSTYTLVVQTRFICDEKLEETDINDLVLHSTTFRHKTGKDDTNAQKEFHESASVVHKMALKAFCTRPREMVMSLSKKMSPGIQVLNRCDNASFTFSHGEHRYEGHRCCSLDTDQAKQWIIVGEERGKVTIWDNRTQKQVHSMKVSRETVICVKFIARKQWLIVGTLNGYIHVYNCETKMRKITSFRATDRYLQLLAVHSTQPYLLSSDNCGIKLWDWDKGFECIHNFEEHSNIWKIAFNLNDTIASASGDHLVKVWSIGSPKSSYTLSGHTRIVTCLDFFTCDDQEYLVTGSYDQTAKVWDMRTKICIHTLEAFVSAVTHVFYEPNLKILITCSYDGCIYFWNTLNSYRLVRIIDTGIGFHDYKGLAFLMGRVVIGMPCSTMIMDINNVNNYEEEHAYEYNEPELTGYTTCKVAPTGSSSQQPLEICLLCEDDPCSLHLTNKKDAHVVFCLTERSGKYGLPSECPNWEVPYVICPSREVAPYGITNSGWVPYGIVPPRSTYILFLRPSVYSFMPEDPRDLELILHSSISGDRYTFLFASQFECSDFFSQAKDTGNMVHQLSVKEGDTKSAQLVNSPRVKITSRKMFGHKQVFYSVDAHPTEPWIVTGNATGEVMTWHYYSRSIVGEADHQVQAEGFDSGRSISSEGSVDCLRYAVLAVKIIARKQWILSGTGDGVIHVYKCVSGLVHDIEEIATFRAPDEHHVRSLAVHPTQPHVVLSKEPPHDLEVEVWDWNEGWECTETSRADVDMYSFVSAAHSDGGVELQVGSPDNSPKSDHTLPGHSDSVNCLHYFTRDDRQYLITGSKDCTAKIWDLQKRACIHTMAPETTTSPVISVTSLLPHRPYLLTGSEYGTVQVWSSTDFRLEGTINLGDAGPVRGLAYLMAQRRVVIAQEQVLSTMEIDQEVEVVASEDNNENYVSPSG